MIPKIIHYCWFGKNPIPEKDQKCIESWKKFCPDYDIIEWNENNFDINCCQYVKEAYEAKKWAFVSDYVRLKVIHDYGGIYFDTDVELIAQLDALLKYDSYFGFENESCIATGLGFGAVAYNKMVKAMLDDYDNIHFRLENDMFDTTTCPERNTNTLMKFGLKQNNTLQIINNNAFLPTDFLCPIDYLTGKKNITKNTVSIHWYNASWQSDEEKLYHQKFSKLSKFLGDNLSDIVLGIYFSIKKEGVLPYIKKRIR